MTFLLGALVGASVAPVLRAVLPHLGRTYPAGRPRPLEGELAWLDDHIEGRADVPFDQTIPND